MLIRYYTPSPRNHYEGYKGLEEPRKPRSKTLLKKKEKKRREEEIVNPHRYIQNLFGGERHIPIKNKVSSNGVYIQYEGNGDTYFKALSLENYLKKNQRAHNRYNWSTKTYKIFTENLDNFEYDKNNKKAEKEMFTFSDYVTIT